MKHRQVQDAYFRRARAEGYAARSAYKLLEIQRRARLIRPGDRVLDLGCAPGSWLQVAQRLIGPGGVAVGVDREPVTIPLGPGVRTLVADVFDLQPQRLTEAAGGAFDVVLSDMAPRTAGGSTDHFRSIDLCRRVLEMLPALLRPGGHLAMKVFEGEQYPALLAEVRALFERARGLRPPASRSRSREIYIVALGHRSTGVARRPS